MPDTGDYVKFSVRHRLAKRLQRDAWGLAGLTQEQAPTFDRSPRWLRSLRQLVPHTEFAVVERDGQPELVIWRQWLWNAYDIVSLAGKWGRWDRERIKREAAP